MKVFQECQTAFSYFVYYEFFLKRNKCLPLCVSCFRALSKISNCGKLLHIRPGAKLAFVVPNHFELEDQFAISAGTPMLPRYMVR